MNSYQNNWKTHGACFLKPGFLQVALHYYNSCIAIAHSPANLLQYTIVGPSEAKLSAKSFRSPFFISWTFSFTGSSLLSSVDTTATASLFFSISVTQRRDSTNCSLELRSCGLVGEYIHGQQHLLKAISRRHVVPAFPSVAASITSLFSMCFSIFMKCRGL